MWDLIKCFQSGTMLGMPKGYGCPTQELSCCPLPPDPCTLPSSDGGSSSDGGCSSGRTHSAWADVTAKDPVTGLLAFQLQIVELIWNEMLIAVTSPRSYHIVIKHTFNIHVPIHFDVVRDSGPLQHVAVLTAL